MDSWENLHRLLSISPDLVVTRWQEVGSRGLCML
jgi:hypothetical protein